MPTNSIRGIELSPQQRQLWKLQKRDGSAAYNGVCSILIDGETDATLMASALRKVVEDNESLRTAFQLLPGMGFPLQVVLPNTEVIYERRDLSQLSSEDQARQSRLWLDSGIREDSKLENASLMRARHILLGPERS